MRTPLGLNRKLKRVTVVLFTFRPTFSAEKPPEIGRLLRARPYLGSAEKQENVKCPENWTFENKAPIEKRKESEKSSERKRLSNQTKKEKSVRTVRNARLFKLRGSRRKTLRGPPIQRLPASGLGQSPRRRPLRLEGLAQASRC